MGGPPARPGCSPRAQLGDGDALWRHPYRPGEFQRRTGGRRADGDAGPQFGALKATRQPAIEHGLQGSGGRLRAGNPRPGPLGGLGDKTAAISLPRMGPFVGGAQEGVDVELVFSCPGATGAVPYATRSGGKCSKRDSRVRNRCSRRRVGRLRRCGLRHALCNTLGCRIGARILRGIEVGARGCEQEPRTLAGSSREPGEPGDSLRAIPGGRRGQK